MPSASKKLADSKNSKTSKTSVTGGTTSDGTITGVKTSLETIRAVPHPESTLSKTLTTDFKPSQSSSHLGVSSGLTKGSKSVSFHEEPTENTSSPKNPPRSKSALSCSEAPKKSSKISAAARLKVDTADRGTLTSPCGKSVTFEKGNNRLPIDDEIASISTLSPSSVSIDSSISREINGTVTTHDYRPRTCPSLYDEDPETSLVGYAEFVTRQKSNSSLGFNVELNQEHRRQASMETSNLSVTFRPIRVFTPVVFVEDDGPCQARATNPSPDKRAYSTSLDKSSLQSKINRANRKWDLERPANELFRTSSLVIESLSPDSPNNLSLGVDKSINKSKSKKSVTFDSGGGGGNQPGKTPEHSPRNVVFDESLNHYGSAVDEDDSFNSKEPFDKGKKTSPVNRAGASYPVGGNTSFKIGHGASTSFKIGRADSFKIGGASSFNIGGGTSSMEIPAASFKIGGGSRALRRLPSYDHSFATNLHRRNSFQERRLSNTSLAIEENESPHTPYNGSLSATEHFSFDTIIVGERRMKRGARFVPDYSEMFSITVQQDDSSSTTTDAASDGDLGFIDSVAHKAFLAALRKDNTNQAERPRSNGSTSFSVSM